LTLLALVLRLAFLAYEPETRPTGDERTWIGWGTQSPAGVASPEVRFSPLKTGVLFYPPVYPYFIGLFFTLTGSLLGVRIVQACLSTLLVPAVGRVAARLGGPRAGLWAAAIVAVYPELIWFSVHFWSETVFLVLLWWALERVLEAGTRARCGAAIAAGLLWGLAVLTRETVLYFTPVAALWLGWRAWVHGRGAGDARALRRAARQGLLFVLLTVAVVAPWTWRNWVVFEAFIPVSTAGGLNLWQGNARLTRQEVYDRYQAVQGIVEQYRHARRMGLAAIAERQPGWLFEKLRAQLPLFWEADSLALVHVKRGAYGEVPRTTTALVALVVLVPYLALLALFVGALRRLRLTPTLLLLLAFLVYYMLLHVATHGFARYRLPALPVVFVVASVLLAARPGPAWLASVRPVRTLVALLLALLLGTSVTPSLVGWWTWFEGGPVLDEGGGAS
jgi:4-amino-4-deoxy-L-arabinose transferase-like glycosyltransferase